MLPVTDDKGNVGANPPPPVVDWQAVAKILARALLCLDPHKTIWITQYAISAFDAATKQEGEA